MLELPNRAAGAQPPGEAQQRELLKLVDAASLPSLLKDGMEATLLCLLLCAALKLLVPEEPAAGLRLLHSLQAVPRFALALSMLSAQQKAAARGAWDAAEQSLSVDATLAAELLACRTTTFSGL